MDLTGIRADIETAVEAERTDGAFRRLIMETLSSVRPEIPGEEAGGIASRAVSTVEAFVLGVPSVVEATLAAARSAGVLETVTPIFETALQYTEEDADFIPDDVGLAGVLDDAYLIYGLMQEIGERYRFGGIGDAEAGPVPASTIALMGDIKRLIGDPTATRLEMAIVAFARRQNVKDTIGQIYRRIGGPGLAMEMPSSAKIPGARSPLADVPDLELGRRWGSGG